MDKDIWLSYEIFDWDGTIQSSIYLDEDKWRRSYEIWNRASFLIEKNESQFDLIDGISNLKRSLNQRLLLIEDLYHFKSINFKNKPKGYLELLQCFDLVRPYIMKTLLYIRNDIEHNDTNPPEQSRCKELVDVVWYFLKSTDSYVQIMNYDFIFKLYNNKNEETHYWFSGELDYKNHENVTLSGWFPERIISNEERIGHFLIKVNDYHGKEKFTGYHQEKLITDKWIAGNAYFLDEKYKKILSKILSLY